MKAQGSSLDSWATRTRENAAVERREASALRYWVRDASGVIAFPRSWAGQTPDLSPGDPVRRRIRSTKSMVQGPWLVLFFG